MRRFRPAGPAAACLLALLHAVPAVAAPQTPAQAFAELNAWRAEARVPAVTTLDDGWNGACAAHVSYMIANGGVTHYEVAGNPGYSDAGYQAGIHSVLFFSSSDQAGPRIFDHGVYHRMALLEPRLRTTGWASSGGYGCMFKDGLDSAATSAGLAAYPWPADGMTGVPTAMQGAESPDPHADAGTSGPLGYLLSVNWNGPWSVPGAAATDVTSASLTPDGGAPVDVGISDKDAPNGWAVSPGFALLPKAPLAKDRWFTATATGTVSGFGFAPQPFTVSWRFGTGDAPPPPGGGPATPYPGSGSGSGSGAGSGAPGGSAPGGDVPAATPGTARARIAGLRARRTHGRLVVTGRVRPAVRGLRVTARLRAGHRVRRAAAREGRSGRFTLRLRTPRRARQTVVVTVPAAPGRHAAARARIAVR